MPLFLYLSPLSSYIFRRYCPLGCFHQGGERILVENGRSQLFQIFCKNSGKLAEISQSTIGQEP